MKILVVRFSSIGDIVLTSPIVRALKTQLADSEVHFLTKAQFSVIVENNKYIDKVHTIKKSIDEVLIDLKDEHFDHVVDLHHNIRTKALKNKLGVSTTHLKKLNFKKLLLVKFKWNMMPAKHVVERYFETASALNVIDDGKGGEFFIPNERNVDMERDFQLKAGSYISIAIGAQYATKRMPVELLAKICNRITSPIVIVGGEMDNETAKGLVAQTTNKNVYNACGKYDILGSASIVAQSSRLLTNDTGMMHIGACLNVEISSVWGNTVPAFGMYPYYPNNKDKYSIHQVDGLSCRPCSKIGYQKCPKGHFNCMKQQNVEEIVASLQ